MGNSPKTSDRWMTILQEFEIPSQPPGRAIIDVLLVKCKENMVKARYAGDDDTSKHLSQIKAHLNNIGRSFCGCGHRKSRGAAQCPKCKLGEPHVVRILPNYVEYNVPITIRKQPSVMRDALMKLDKVGASIVTPSMSINHAKEMAKSLGIGVLVRTVDSKHIRVWRTDGKSLEEVNEIIRKNAGALNGERATA